MLAMDAEDALYSPSVCPASRVTARQATSSTCNTKESKTTIIVDEPRERGRERFLNACVSRMGKVGCITSVNTTERGGNNALFCPGKSMRARLCGIVTMRDNYMQPGGIISCSCEMGECYFRGSGGFHARNRAC